MIIVINAQGKVLAQQNDDLFQGSVKANVIDLVAPFANNVTMYASFELPDGTYYQEEEMRHSVKVIDGLNVWKQILNFPVTKNYGIVTMQFRAVVGNQTICSGSAKIPIQKGVPYIKEDDLEPTQYEELKALISDVKALIGNKVEIVSGNYEVANVNEDTVGTYYIYQDETDGYLPVFLPENYQTGTVYYSLNKIGRVINDSKGVYLEYVEDGKKITLKLTNDGVTINDDKIVTDKVLEENLIAEKVKYNSEYTKLNAGNVQEAIDKLNYNMREIENSQVIDLGNHTLKASNWINGEVYTYKFKHELFTNALVQGLIITPNREAIDNLNNNDILIYPEIDIEQESENVAVAIIKAETRPNFDIVANIKIQGTTVNANTEKIQANQIVFVPTDKITSNTVQKAVVEVQKNVDDLKTLYNTEKTEYVKLDSNGKVPASQLPAYVDDVIECYLHNGAMYLTRSGLGTEDDPYTYTNAVPAVSGKIFVDLQTNKQYRWSGTQYTIISESLALGETEGTAYSGAKGKANSDNIKKLNNDITEINSKKINVYSNKTDTIETSVGIEPKYKGSLFEVEYIVYTYKNEEKTIDGPLRNRIYLKHINNSTSISKSLNNIVEDFYSGNKQITYIWTPLINITENSDGEYVNYTVINFEKVSAKTYEISEDGTVTKGVDSTIQKGFAITNIWVVKED